MAAVVGVAAVVAEDADALDALMVIAVGVVVAAAVVINGVGEDYVQEAVVAVAVGIVAEPTGQRDSYHRHRLRHRRYQTGDVVQL